MKPLSTLILAMSMYSIALSQNINFEVINVSLYRLPLKPLSVTPRTFSTSIQDLAGELKQHQVNHLTNALAIPGFNHVSKKAGVHLELVVSPLSITNKELKDNPYTVEKDGVKTVYHKYHYLINYSYPAKLRILKNDGQVTEQDLAGFFQTKFYGRQADTETALQSQFDGDYSFTARLQEERISERVEKLKETIFDLYGYGMHSERLTIGYLKDKKGEYGDLNRAMALIRDAFLYASNKEIYLDDTFTSKANEASTILLKSLLESSEDKKARINQKVTGMINYNLALISYGMRNFEKAIEYSEKAKHASNNIEFEASNLKQNVHDQQSRLKANADLKENYNQLESVTDAPPQPALPPLQSLENNYVVNKLGDTLRVQFILPSTEAMPFGDSVWIQKMIITKRNNKPYELYPEDLHGFCYKGTYHESLWWVADMRTNPWTIEKKFCKRIISGAIPVYTCNEVNTDEEGYKKVKSKMYYKKNDNILEVMFLNFDRRVSKLVAEHQELSEKVRNGDFERDDFLQILKEYNVWTAKSSN